MDFITSGPTDVLFTGTDIDGSNPYLKTWFYGKFGLCLMHLRHHVRLAFANTCVVAHRPFTYNYYLIL